VLALGYRELAPDVSVDHVLKWPRSEAERPKSLVFAGFLVLTCPLKPDSKSVVTELLQSNHKVCGHDLPGRQCSRQHGTRRAVLQHFFNFNIHSTSTFLQLQLQQKSALPLQHYSFNFNIINVTSTSFLQHPSRFYILP
jgi:hypothetical protein